MSVDAGRACTRIIRYVGPRQRSRLPLSRAKASTHSKGGTRMRASTLRTGLFGLALTVVFAGPTAFAEEMKFKADLKGSEQVPPVETSATGTADVTYDSDEKTLAW